MGSTRNGWCKKLIAKGKAHALKRALGNEVSVMTHAARTRNVQARAKDLLDIKDKPLPKGPKNEEKAPLPRVAGWKPKRHGDTRWGNKYSHA